MRLSKSEKLRVLVTGAAGPYGAHFAKLALDQGHEVFSIRRTVRPYDSATLLGIADKITWVNGDIRDSGFLLHCLAAWNIQAVAHFAALPIVSSAPAMRQTVWSVNCTGTVSLLDAIRQYRPETLVLFVSTDKVLGYVGDRPYTEGMAPKPIAPYDTSKYAAEVACRSYQAMGYVPNLVVTRSCNVIASADLNWRLVPNTIRQFLCNVPAKVYTSGQKQREFIAVEDACAAQMLCLLRADETPGETFHIGSGHQWVQEEAIEYIRAKHFPNGQIVRVPPPQWHPIEIPYQRLDCTKIEQQHGWRPNRPVPMAVDDLVMWWKKHVQLAAWSLL